MEVGLSCQTINHTANDCEHECELKVAFFLKEVGIYFIYVSNVIIYVIPHVNVK